MVKGKPLFRSVQQSLNVSEREVPVHVLFEKRRYARASITNKGVVIRLPYYINSNEAAGQIESFKKWAVKKLSENPEFYSARRREFYSGRVIAIRDKAFILNLKFSESKSSKAALQGDQIVISLSSYLTEEEMESQIVKLVSKCIGAEFYQWLLERLNYLNEVHLPQRKFKTLALKYVNSVWGSCSTDGKIIISTRLLFAPDYVIDYVLIHELVHLLVHSHSSRFWKKVSELMPDYERSERWLKAHGTGCDF